MSDLNDGGLYLIEINGVKRRKQLANWSEHGHAFYDHKGGRSQQCSLNGWWLLKECRKPTLADLTPVERPCSFMAVEKKQWPGEPDRWRCTICEMESGTADYPPCMAPSA